jgi:putative transposase
MRRLDELYLKYPFMGARRLVEMLKREGQAVGWRHVGTLMKR